MKSQMTHTLLGLVLVTLVSFPAYPSENLPELEGVFGLAEVNEATALAFWVPLGEGESVSGIQWYCSDGDVIFPEFLAVAGEAGHPELLVEATIVAQQVSGESLSWCAFSFDQPLATTAGGLYLIWKLPVGCVFTEAGNGGGAGFGFTPGGNENNCWVTSSGEDWDSFSIPHQMAMIAIMNSDKSNSVLVLSKPGDNQPPPEMENPFDDRQNNLQLAAFPNPFNPSTRIVFHLQRPGQTDISIFDLRGRLVKNLQKSFLDKGLHKINWDGISGDGLNASSGLYLVRISTREFQETIRITLTK